MSLQGTAVTDQGVMNFEKSSTLKWLMFSGTFVSKEVAEALKVALPECDVVGNPPVPDGLSRESASK